MAKFLLPHQLTADHFDPESDAAEYGDLYAWAESFFGMRPDDVVDGIGLAIDAALEAATGDPVVVNAERDNRGLLQQRLSPEQLLGVWQKALGLSVQDVEVRDFESQY